MIQSSTWKTLGRHQVGSIVATFVDFGLMTLLVVLGVCGATPATAFGASLGAVTNFTLGRTWIFAAQSGAAAPQALRYALVSGASAGLNAFGEHISHDRLGMQFLLARALVAVVVSLVWNFPLQRAFVFRSTSPSA